MTALLSRSNLLGNLLWFYEAQRSGPLPSNNRVSWRNDSALNDGKDYGADLVGGYYDAGGLAGLRQYKRCIADYSNFVTDYIKATYPLAYTLFSVCWGANTYGGGYDHANQTAYLDGMLRWGLDWLIKVRQQTSLACWILTKGCTLRLTLNPTSYIFKSGTVGLYLLALKPGG